MSIYLVSCTFYRDPFGRDSSRFHCAKSLCQQVAIQEELRCVIVDDSGNAHNQIKEELERDGKGKVAVIRQVRKGNKGTAIREAIDFAVSKMNTEDSAILFTEVEKADIPRLAKQICEPLIRNELDIVFPTREEGLFRKTYAVEQYYSEKYGNKYIYYLCREFIPEELDYYFGPFAFRKNHAKFWLEYKGDSWDAQAVPALLAVKNFKSRIGSVTIDYSHDEKQKRQEEGNLEFCKKRLFQLTSRLPTIEDSLSTD